MKKRRVNKTFLFFKYYDRIKIRYGEINMARKTRLEIEENYNDCWIYILLLTTLAILLESIKTYEFSFVGVKISYAILGLPFTYLIVNYISKKYDYKKAIAAISISGVISVCFMAMMSFALGKNLILSNISGEFCGYVVSHFVNLTIYLFILSNTKASYPLILVNYLFSIIVFYMLYTLIYLNKVIYDSYWTSYFITIGIDSIISFILAYVDSKIKRGK